MTARTLYAFYDLEFAPTCFDIMKFLVLADLSRRKKGLTDVHIVFVPAAGDGFRADDFNKSIEIKQWRLRQLMVSATPLLASCSGVTVCSTRDEARGLVEHVVRHVYPDGYDIEAPVIPYNWSDVMVELVAGERIPTLHTPTPALDFATQWLATNLPPGRKPVTLTLREMDFQEERNSNLAAWSTFARELKDGGVFEPIILRDTAMSFAPVPPELADCLQFREGTFHMELRSAIYERSHTNLMISNGPIEICMLNPRISYAKIKVRVPRTITIGYPEGGVAYQEQHPLNGPGRLWWWEDDTLDSIRRCFAEIIRQLDENGGKPGPETADGLFPAYELDPVTIALRLATGSSCAQAKRILDAIGPARRNDPLVWAARGHIHLGEKNFAAGRQAFEAAIALDGACADYSHHLGQCLLQLGDPRAALSANLRAESLDPTNYRYPLASARLYEDVGEIRDALAAYKRALALGCDPIVVNARCGVIHEALGEFDDALKHYLFVREKLPDDPRPLEWLAHVYSATGRFKEAAEARMAAFRLTSSA